MEKEPLTVQTVSRQLKSGDIVTVAKLTGYFDTYEEEVAILDYISKQKGHIIMDFSEVTGVYIDIFPGFLVKFVDQVESGGKKVVMAGMSGHLKAVFDMLGLDSFIIIQDTIQDALEYF